MKKIAAVGFAMFASTASAQVANDAEAIALTVGSAETCGYSLDKQKVVATVQEKVATASDADRDNFQYLLSVQGDRLGRLSDIERTAQCALQEKMADKFGLTP